MLDQAATVQKQLSGPPLDVLLNTVYSINGTRGAQYYWLIIEMRK